MIVYAAILMATTRNTLGRTMMSFLIILCIVAKWKSRFDAATDFMDFRNNVPITTATTDLALRHKILGMYPKFNEMAMTLLRAGKSVCRANKRGSYDFVNSPFRANLKPLPHVKNVLCVLVMILSGDIQTNPGPINFPCKECGKAVRSNQRAVQCDGCDEWIHTACTGISKQAYQNMKGTSATWICCTCGMPNFSSTFFTSMEKTVLSNHFCNLSSRVNSISHPAPTSDSESDDSACHSPLAPGKPLRASTPQPKTGASKPRAKTMSTPFRILVINFRSLLNKLSLLDAVIEEKHPDVILGSETWLTVGTKDSEICPSGYNVFRKDRGSRGGGVLIMVSDKYTAETLPALDSKGESIWVKIELLGRKTLNLGAFYRPDVSHAESLVDLEDTLSKLRNVPGDVFYGGDFNFPGWDWESQTIKEGSSALTLHQCFGDILDDNALVQVVREPTRGQNTLDLMITNNPGIITCNTVVPGLSDHDIPLIELDVNPALRKQKKRQVPQYRKANWKGLEGHMKQVRQTMDYQARNGNCTTEDLWSTFRAGLEKGVKQHIPHCQTKDKNGLPWLSNNTKKMMKRRNRLHKKLKQNSTTERQKRYSEIKRDIQRSTRREYWGYMEGIFTSNDEGPKQQHSGMKKFWAFIKRKKSGNSSSVAPLQEGDITRSDAKGKAEILNRQFVNAFSKRQPISLAQSSTDATGNHSTHPMPNIEVTSKGVEKLLANLKPDKAAGPDQIQPRVLKQLSTVIATPLAMIFNSSLREGQIPGDWRQALVTPIYKKGKKSDPANYRPVSLTCICCKVIEHIIVSNIMRHAQEHNLLYDLQHGFRSRRSCETQLLGFVDDLMRKLDAGRQTDVVVMDFAKAFDKVEHSHLCHKLRRYGIGGETNTWIHNFLAGRTQRVVVDGESSDWANVLSGVPQGSVLGPCLFLFYINDMPDGIKAKIRLFADDTIMYMTVSSKSPGTLQDDLNKLVMWESNWHMMFHPDKCEILSITRSKNPIITNYTLRGHILKRTISAKYLGINLDHKLSWRPHICNITAKANSTLGFLRRNLQINSRTIKERAFNTLVRPTLEYCSSVWDPSTQDAKHMIEMVQRRGARYVAGRYRRTSSVGEMLNELSWCTLEERRRKTNLTVMYKIMNNHVAINIEDHLVKSNRHSKRVNNTMAYQIPNGKTEAYNKSFFPKTIREWNKLPNSVAASLTIEEFKAAVAGTPSPAT